MPYETVTRCIAGNNYRIDRSETLKVATLCLKDPSKPANITAAATSAVETPTVVKPAPSTSPVNPKT